LSHLSAVKRGYAMKSNTNSYTYPPIHLPSYKLTNPQAYPLINLLTHKPIHLPTHIPTILQAY